MRSRLHELVLMVALVFLGTCTLALAVDPDEVRERAKPPPVTYEQVQKHEKTDQTVSGPEALSSAFKKYATMRMLAWRVMPSGNLMVMGNFNSPEHCAAARKLLQRQLVRLGWGRAECLEYVVQ